MGKSHAKNNCAGSVFTYTEKSRLAGEYGTRALLVGRESMKDFDACFLCLQPARDAVACCQGHIACKECMLENILAQKKECQRQQRIADRQATEAEAESRKKQKLAADTELDKFASVQDRPVLIHAAGPSKVTTNNGKPVQGAAADSSFWVPSLTPDSLTECITPKTKVLCPIGDDHPLALKKLISVQFSTDGTGADNKICLSCRRTLSNSIELVLVKGCGHIVCATCSDKFQLEALRCFVCAKSVKSAADFIRISAEGTGYAGKGNVQVKRYDLAFKA